jgi:hypothetical protein
MVQIVIIDPFQLPPQQPSLKFIYSYQKATPEAETSLFLVPRPNPKSYIQSKRRGGSTLSSTSLSTPSPHHPQRYHGDLYIHLSPSGHLWPVRCRPFRPYSIRTGRAPNRVGPELTGRARVEVSNSGTLAAPPAPSPVSPCSVYSRSRRGDATGYSRSRLVSGEIR